MARVSEMASPIPAGSVRQLSKLRMERRGKRVDLPRLPPVTMMVEPEKSTIVRSARLGVGDQVVVDSQETGIVVSVLVLGKRSRR